MKELKKECGFTVRDITCYCEMSTSTLYAAERGEEMALSSFLRLFSFYISQKGYIFDYHVLAQSIAESIRAGRTLSLLMEGAENSPEIHLLHKSEEDSKDEHTRLDPV